MNFSFNPNNLIDLNYWISPDPGPGQVLFLIVALKISLLFLIGGVVMWYLQKKKFATSAPHRRVLEQIMWVFYGYSFTFFLLTFLRSQGFEWVSIRLVWLLVLLSFLPIAGYYINYFQTKIPTQLEKIATDNLKKKYFRTKTSKKKK